MIPVNVITGFLGSGKTTLLNEVLRRPEFSDAAVIVNEFGEIGLDHILLEEVDEGVLLLENGCVCCTIRSDLQETIRGLQAKVSSGAIEPFSRVFVETTGLADPAPIVSTVLAEPVIRNHFRIGNVVCTIDAVAGLSTLRNQPEALKQVAVADRLLLTKSDLADGRRMEALEAEVRRCNPFAPLRRSEGRAFDASFLFERSVAEESTREQEVAGWFSDEAHGATHQHDHGHHAGTAHAFTIDLSDSINWTAFGIWLTAVLHAHGEKILRVKGILNVRESETPVVIHGVQHVVHPPLHLKNWPGDSRKSRLVFITRGVEESRIRHSLDTFLNIAEPVAFDREHPVMHGAECHG